MTYRPRILMDVDGPLTEGLLERACKILRSLGVEAARPNGVTMWGIYNSFGASPEVGAEMWRQLQAPGVALSFEPRPESKDFLCELRRWADVIAVTAPLDGSVTWAQDREIWLEREMSFSSREIVSARDKSLIRGDALVDDRLENLMGWQTEHPRGFAIMWEEPYNIETSWRGHKVCGNDYAYLLRFLRRYA